MWSDGQPLNADDVVFTIEMLQGHAPDLWHSAELNEWVKDVKKVDDLTVQFDLSKPNPRFQLDYFSVRIWGGVSVLPKHIWEGQDPSTFTNADLLICDGESTPQGIAGIMGGAAAEVSAATRMVIKRFTQP